MALGVGADATPVVSSCNGFGAAVYSHLVEGEENVIFSPLSAWASLAMAYAGARGGTAEAMATALHVTPGAGDAHGQFGALLSQLLAAGSGKGCKLEIADAVWLQRGAPVKTEFVQVVAGPYRGEIAEADFAGDPARAAARVNEWVSLKTHGKVSRLLAAGDLDAQTRLVLANAVYFKGQWASRFPTGKTQEEPFFLRGGRTETVPLMHQTGDFMYAESEGTQALVMPYRGGALAILVVLPPAPGPGQSREPTELGAPDVGEWLGRLQPYEVDVTLPRFSISSNFALKSALVALGMGEAFDPGRADLSGIDGLRDLFLQTVVQGAIIEVDEEGTTAAAGTAVGIGCGVEAPLPKAVFRADRPSAFAIVHTESGLTLFMGRVADPALH